MNQTAQTLFRVFLEGGNFLIRLDGRRRRFGFFVTRFVEAQDEADAATRSVRLLWDELSRKGGVLNDAADAPRIVVDRIEEIDPADKPDTNPGFAWFPEDNLVQ